MKYGAGSALLSDVMARSSSRCSVCSNTGSLAPAAAVCPGNAGTANSNRKRLRNKDFTNDIATDECTSSFRHRKCYLGVLPVSSEARDPYGYEGYRVAGERSVSKTAYASHKSIPDKLLGEVGFPHPQKTQVRDFKRAPVAVKFLAHSPTLFAEAGFHRNIGFLAAAVSSSRFTLVVCGAFLTNSGSSSASRAIDFIASTSKSSSSSDSLSVGSIMIAPCTTSGNDTV